MKNSGEAYGNNFGQHANCSNDTDYSDLVEDEEMDVPETVEEILELLLSSLRDSVRMVHDILMCHFPYWKSFTYQLTE